MLTFLSAWPLKKVGIRHKYSQEMESLNLWHSLRERNAITPGLLEVKIVHEDPDDDIIVACAIEAGADYIISGDQHLLDLKHYREIQIVAPAAFLQILDHGKALKMN